MAVQRKAGGEQSKVRLRRLPGRCLDLGAWKAARRKPLRELVLTNRQNLNDVIHRFKSLVAGLIHGLPIGATVHAATRPRRNVFAHSISFSLLVSPKCRVDRRTFNSLEHLSTADK